MRETTRDNLAPFAVCFTFLVHVHHGKTGGCLPRQARDTTIGRKEHSYLQRDVRLIFTLHRGRLPRLPDFFAHVDGRSAGAHKVEARRSREGVVYRGPLGGGWAARSYGRGALFQPGASECPPRTRCGRKNATFFGTVLNVENPITLPRQARDRHRKSRQQSGVFCCR